MEHDRDNQPEFDSERECADGREGENSKSVPAATLPTVTCGYAEVDPTKAKPAKMLARTAPCVMASGASKAVRIR
jgi:hypothetical protein